MARRIIAKIAGKEGVVELDHVEDAGMAQSIDGPRRHYRHIGRGRIVGQVEFRPVVTYSFDPDSERQSHWNWQSEAGYFQDGKKIR